MQAIGSLQVTTRPAMSNMVDIAPALNVPRPPTNPTPAFILVTQGPSVSLLTTLLNSNQEANLNACKPNEFKPVPEKKRHCRQNSKRRSSGITNINCREKESHQKLDISDNINRDLRHKISDQERCLPMSPPHVNNTNSFCKDYKASPIIRNDIDLHSQSDTLKEALVTWHDSESCDISMDDNVIISLPDDGHCELTDINFSDRNMKKCGDSDSLTFYDTDATHELLGQTVEVHVDMDSSTWEEVCAGDTLEVEMEQFQSLNTITSVNPKIRPNPSCIKPSLSNSANFSSYQCQCDTTTTDSTLVPPVPETPLSSSGSEASFSPPDYLPAPVEGATGSSTAPAESHPSPILDDEDSDPLDIGRLHHNAKERIRRARIKEACDKMRELVPGLTDKTDKATVFEFAAKYIIFLRKNVTHYQEKEFLQEVNPY